MIITDIVPLDKKRSRIYIDFEFAFVLYKGEFKEYNISLNSEISRASYEAILTKLLPKRAKLRGLALLTKKPYTEKQLRDKYDEGEYPDSVIDEAIEYLKGFGYIDDVKYCLEFFETYKETRSLARMKNDLRGKGVSGKDIEKAYRSFEESEDSGIDEESQIRRILTKKRFNPDEADYTERQKMIASLMRKGYSYDAISNCIRNSDF